MDRIPPDEVAFHPHSHGDPAGRLFLWKGKLFRGIRAGWTPVWAHLLETGVLQGLVDRGLLIDTQAIGLSLDGFELVVQHRLLPVASYPEEWCPAMLKDAALAILDLVIEVTPYDLTLKDGHPWNVMFESGRFLYVDLTSLAFRPEDGGWPGYNSFCRSCLYPLLLMGGGHDRIARRLLPETEGVRKSELQALLRGSARLPDPSAFAAGLRSAWERRVPASYRGLFRRRLGILGARTQQRADNSDHGLKYLKRLRQQVDGIALSGGTSQPLPQDANIATPVTAKHTWSSQQHALHQLLVESSSESVLTIGGETEWCCRMAAHLNKRVVSFDSDQARVTRLYNEVRTAKLPILPLVMDFADPTPARGLFGHWAIAATDRFRCDLVIALNLVHHMVFRKFLDFAHIAGGLGLLSKRRLVVEFVYPEDAELHHSATDRCAWYTLDNFVDALKREFRTVTIMSPGGGSRPLLVCEK